MRPLLVVSVAVAVGLGGTPPVAFAAVESPPEADPPAPTEPTEPVESVEPAEPAEPTEPAAEVEPPPLDTDTEPEPLDTDEDTALDETLDRDDADESFDDGYIFLRHSPEAKTARRWLSAGIAATITGGVLVGGAIAMGLTDPCEFTSGNNCFRDARDRAAVTLGAPGGLLLVGGVTMTIVGSLQRRRLWYGQVAITPALDGVVVSGRF